MAVPFRRTSKMKKRVRRSHQALSVPGMITCPNCGCYKGKQIVAPKADKTEE